MRMRVLRWIAVAVGLVVIGVVGLVAVLVITNPIPTSVAGWGTLADLPDARGEVASAVAERDGAQVLVLAGGLTGLGGTSTAVHELLDDGWRRLPDLPEPRHHAAAAALEGDVYVSGGAPSVRAWSPQEAVWVLRQGASSWEAVAPMPEGRDSHRMRALDGRLYVVGGSGTSADTLVYDPVADRWERAAPLPVPRHHLAVVVDDGELWAIGGRDGDEVVLDDVHVWRPGEDSWRDGPRLPQPVSAAVEGVVEGRIHLIGGEDPATVRGGVIDGSLVLADGSWREAGPTPMAVHGAGGGVVGGQLVVAGGARRQGLWSVVSWTGFTAVYRDG